MPPEKHHNTGMAACAGEVEVLTQECAMSSCLIAEAVTERIVVLQAVSGS